MNLYASPSLSSGNNYVLVLALGAALTEVCACSVL